MKHLLAVTILLFNLSTVSAQQNSERAFFQTNSKTHLYYVEPDNANGIVYHMGGYLDKAGSGYSIRKTDTLMRQAGGVYTGKSIRVLTENNKTWNIASA
ncbi:hypothetical protein [Terrimonas alba]|uniref:hypothetical protein n=1 Tax=Terrimonas alba TaxID=3349636 RepID=UPI0035F277B5